MCICLSGGSESSVGTATGYRLDDPGFQPQWWQDKQYQSTFSRILVFTQCRMMYSAVECYATDAFLNTPHAVRLIFL